MTVEGLGYEELDTRTLAKDHIAEKALTGDSLLLAQDKLGKGEAAPQKAQREVVSELDVAVDYGHGSEPEV